MSPEQKRDLGVKGDQAVVGEEYSGLELMLEGLEVILSLDYLDESEETELNKIHEKLSSL